MVTERHLANVWFVKRIPMLVAFVCLLLGGCTPVPYVSPPIRASLGFGPVGGERARTDTGEVETVNSAASISARFSVNPLGLIRSQMDRHYDFGLGYLLEDTLSSKPERPSLHGPYLEATGYFLRHMTSPHSALRLGLVSRGDLLFSEVRNNDMGWGFAGGLVFEFSTFLDPQPITDDKVVVKRKHGRVVSEDVRPSMIGVAYGELAIGAEILGGWREVGPEKYWYMMGSLVFRLPASAGVYFIYFDEQD